MKKISGILRIECAEDDRVEWFGILGTAVYRLRDLGWDLEEMGLQLTVDLPGEKPEPADDPGAPTEGPENAR